MRSLLAYLRSFWSGARRPSALDADMADEMRFHIEMETRRLQQRGLSADEAARQAAIAFGGVEKYRGAGRDALGLTWLRGISTDMKLGTRMLRKHPGLTAVALFALSLAIGAGAAYLEFINDLMHGKLPFVDADRIVGIQTWDQQTGSTETRVTADFVRWRESLRSMESLAAYRTFQRNLITGDRAEPVEGVEMSAVAFDIAGVPPMLGRTLQPADERRGAPAVAVIGYDLWAARFASDTSIIGTSIRLGKDPYTIVGVMPRTFGMPVNETLWVPLSINEATYAPLDGPATRVFGKLAAGVPLSEAQAELDAIAQRAARDFPNTHQRLHPIVKPYVESLWSAVEDSTMQTTVFYAANVLFIGLLALCGANIATLVFARTATRETEISVRTALGASRQRIAGQLFVEALVLSSLAAAAGLVIASYALQWVKRVVTAGMGSLMFWWDDRLASATIVYAAALAIFAALIIGVIPALKATGTRVQDRLKQSTGAASGGLTFGRVWTGVIVTQVAVTVIFLAIVGMLGWTAYVTGGGKRRMNVRANEYVTAVAFLDRPGGRLAPGVDADAVRDYRRQMHASFTELSRRLEADPLIESVTYGSRLPAMNGEFVRMDIDGVAPPSGERVFDIRTVSVAPNYFDVFEAPIISGRGFTEGDTAPGRNVAIVDRTFARRRFNGQDPVGRQVRIAATDQSPAGPWIEIVGVVADLTDETNKKAGEALLYRPAAPELTRPLYVAMRARTNPAAAASRFRIITADVDPSMRLDNVVTLDKIDEIDRVALDFFARLIGGISIVAIILATAGVYALMSFTVSRRTAEIGIRVALGANPRRIVVATFGRALTQVGSGLLVGSIPAAAIVWSLGPEVASSNSGAVALWTGVLSTTIVATMAAIACIAPARRALRIQPTDALKAE